jgi:hypothetical protein
MGSRPVILLQLGAAEDDGTFVVVTVDVGVVDRVEEGVLSREQTADGVGVELTQVGKTLNTSLHPEQE